MKCLVLWQGELAHHLTSWKYRARGRARAGARARDGIGIGIGNHLKVGALGPLMSGRFPDLSLLFLFSNTTCCAAPEMRERS